LDFNKRTRDFAIAECKIWDGLIRDKSVISRRIKNVFEERELSSTATVAKYATVQREGDRDLSRVRGQ